MLFTGGMFWVVWFLLSLQAFAGDVVTNVLVCGKVTNYYTRSDEELTVLSAVQDINGDNYVNDIDRRESPTLPLLIKTVSRIQSGIYHLGKTETTVSDATAAKEDFISLTSKLTEGYELCVFGDIHYIRYEKAYYLYPTSFVVYSKKFDILVPSELPTVNSQILNYLKNTCQRPPTDTSLSRETHSRLKLQLNLDNGGDKDCPVSIDATITQDKKADIHIDATLNFSGRRASKTLPTFKYSSN